MMNQMMNVMKMQQGVMIIAVYTKRERERERWESCYSQKDDTLWDFALETHKWFC